jgi:hypothetical protein
LLLGFDQDVRRACSDDAKTILQQGGGQGGVGFHGRIAMRICNDVSDGNRVMPGLRM